MPQQRCPHCHSTQEVGRYREGQAIHCVTCQGAFKVVFPRRGQEMIPAPKVDAAPTNPIVNLAQQGNVAPAAAATPRKRRRPPFNIEGYEILDEIGKGGMGTVYLAQQKSLGRKVAIKVLAANLARQQASILRFTKEAAAMAKLSHPNIVYVLDRGVTRQRHQYFIMEFVDGCSLRDLLRDGAFAPLEALQIMLQLSRTMEYAHAQGVIHRDLKPENILYNSNSVLKLADFGLVSVQQGTTFIRELTGNKDLTRSHVSMGTECYMAPEQRQDAKNVDHRADIYSMGVILHELVTHRLPYPHLPAPDVPIVKGYPVIDAIIRRCLETSPLKRFETTTALRNAVEEAISVCEVPARPRQPQHDTVIQEPVSMMMAESNDVTVVEVEQQKDSWGDKIKSSISSISDSFEFRWQRDGLKHFLWGTGALGAFALLVLIVAMMTPTPSSKKGDQISWHKIPAQIQALKDNSKVLSFSLIPQARAVSFLRRSRPLWMWKFGNWYSKDGKLFQNTYKKSLTFNHRKCWALYKGHRLSPKDLSITSAVEFLSPKVPNAAGSLVPLKTYLRSSEVSGSKRRIRRYPTIGLGLRGQFGEELSLLLQPKGRDIKFTFRVRGPYRETNGKRKYPRFSVSHDVVSGLNFVRKPIPLQIKIKGREASAWIDGRLVDTLMLTKTQRFYANAGLVCRDAHCRFGKIQIRAHLSKE